MKMDPIPTDAEIEAELDAEGMDWAIEQMLEGMRRSILDRNSLPALRIMDELRRRETAGRAVLREKRRRQVIGKGAHGSGR